MTITNPGSDAAPFTGFPSGASAVPLPAALFTTLIPQIDDVAELVVTLYAAAAIQRLRRYPRLLDLAALRAERPLVDALDRLLPHDDIDTTLHRGLDAAVARGTLLRLDRPDPAGPSEPGQAETGQSGLAGNVRTFLTLNADADRQALERVRRGEAAVPARVATPEPQPRGPRNIFALYEQTVGPITPQIAEALTEAEALYPTDWISDAFREAAELNKRSWRYVQRILERWHDEGRDNETTGGHSRWRPDPRYEHLIQQ